jgi:hypothetical protein
MQFTKRTGPSDSKNLKGLDEFFQQAQLGQQVQQVINKGYAETPREYRQIEKAEREAIIKVITLVVMRYWNLTHWAIHISKITKETQKTIREMWKMGNWTREIPGTRTLERNVNYSADYRFFDDHKPPLLCVRAGWYCPSPLLFDEETQNSIKQLIQRWRELPAKDLVKKDNYDEKR